MNGVVYIAFGDKYLNEAVQSLKSLKAHSPDLQTCLISDKEVNGFDYWFQFNSIEQLPPLLNKPFALSVFAWTLPFDRFMFLDTDTYILGDITPVFDLLNYCHITVTSCRDKMDNLKLGLPYYNTGVILGHNDIQFWDEWNEIYYPRLHGKNDQASFYDAALRTEYKIFTLSNEFNLRINSKTLIRDKVYILHGRGKRLQTAIETINNDISPRVWNEYQVKKI